MSISKEKGIIQTIADRINQLSKDDVASGILEINHLEQEIELAKNTKNIENSNLKNEIQEQENIKDNVEKIKEYRDAQDALSRAEER